KAYTRPLGPTSSHSQAVSYPLPMVASTTTPPSPTASRISAWAQCRALLKSKFMAFVLLVDGGVNYPQFAMVTLLRLAACSVPASQFSMVAPHRSQAHSRRSLLHWAHRRLLQPLAAPPLSPSLGLLRAASFLNSQ